MAVLDGYGAVVVDGLGTKEEEDGKMGEREGGRVWVGRPVASEGNEREEGEEEEEANQEP